MPVPTFRNILQKSIQSRQFVPFTELGKMVDAGLGNFAHGQPEMTSQWGHVAFVRAGVKVCARDTGVRAGGPGGEGTGLVFIKE